MTPRLPIPGADSDTWGEILNDFLSVSHDTDGTVKPEAITTTSLQDSSVSGTKLQDTSVTSTKLDAGVGTNGQVLTYDSTSTSGFSWAAATVPDDSVSTAKLEDASVSNAKLQDNSISNTKLQDTSVSGAKIQDGAISSSKIQNASITGAMLNAGTGTDSQILTFNSTAPGGLSWVALTIPDNSVSTAKLQDASVTSAKLQDTAVTSAKLNAGAGTDGQYLTKDSVAAGGFSWKTPAAQTVTLSLTSFFKTGTLTTTTGTNRLPIDGTYTIVGTRLMVNTAPTGANIIVDIKKNGTTIYTTQANRPTIAAGQYAGGPGATPDVTALAAGDYLTVDIMQVGSTVAGSDLTVSVIVSKAI